MDIDKIFSAIWEGKEWIFSGIGVVALSVIGKRIIGKKSGENSDTYTVKSKMHDNNNVSGGNNITGKENQIIQNDNSSTISVDGTGNVAGNGNSVTNNFIYNNDSNTKENVNSWFSERFEILLSLLNDARRFNEKEYTVEYVSSLIGLKNVDDLKVYLTQGKEPDDEFKKKFVEVFGVNEEWMVHGRGEFPFASNINFLGDSPMDILRRENLRSINKFIVVIGNAQGKRQTCIIRQKNELCYELYPKYFTLYSHVGGTGTRQLVEFYRFLREADKIKKLDGIAYFANEEQMNKLMRGEFSPKKVERFEVARNFIDDFMCIREDETEKNKRFWDEDFILVQEIIAANIKDYDRINQEYDLKLIKKNLGEDSQDTEEERNDIDLFDSSTPFFDYRFGKAFPGIRGVKEFTDSKECVDRLQILLKKPLNGKKLGGPIWWIRGSGNCDISRFERVTDDKFLMDGDEIKVKRIVAYAAGEYYKKFVYVETYPEEETGLYTKDDALVEEWTEKYGYYYEEYAEYENNKVTRAEYDDGAAVIDGKVVDLNGMAKLRTRYITPYNFIICAHFNPMNSSVYDDMLEKLLNGILKGQNSVEEIVEAVKKMPKHRREMWLT
jgi:hypothetical protein